MERYQEIEHDIITKYRKEIWSKFSKAVSNYHLINEGDKIMVCISGGKDSFLLAKCIEELQKHGKVNFTAVYVTMDPGYSKMDLDKIKENAKILNVDLQIFKTDIFEIVKKVSKEKKPCYLCARMRRGHLYSKAKELGCNKIALGHHFDDVIETTLLSMLYSGEIRTMLPKLKSKNFEGLELIRPLYLVKESSIIKFRDNHNLSFIHCGCPLNESCGINITSKRKEVKNLIKDLRNKDENIDRNIFKALDNVNMSGILGYIDKTGKHTFLDKYDE